MAEALEEPIIDLYSPGDLRQGLPLPHLPEELSFVLIEGWWIIEVLASRDEGKPKCNLRVLGCVSR